MMSARAKIDRRRIQRIARLLQVRSEGFAGMETARRERQRPLPGREQPRWSPGFSCPQGFRLHKRLARLASRTAAQQP